MSNMFQLPEVKSWLGAWREHYRDRPSGDRLDKFQAHVGRVAVETLTHIDDVNHVSRIGVSRANTANALNFWNAWRVRRR